MKKIAIITGASSGIGKEFVKAISNHAEYDELWAIARNKERLEELRDVTSIPVKPISLDLSSENFIDSFKELLAAEEITIKTLINCSGYGKFDSLENIALEDNLGMIDLNCRALVAITYLSIPYMTKGSEIIEIASVAAFQPIPYINVYGASKAFVLSFSRALGRELKGKGIRVLAVCPFWTKTAFFDRAVNKDKNAVVKKYAAMYEPEYIVKYALKSLKKKNKDFCIPGFIAKAQVFLVKLLPHKIIMSIWQSQQKLK